MPSDPAESIIPSKGFEEPERKLAAILAADVVGFSRMMGLDEVGTLARLDSARRTVVDPVIAAHRGRIFKLMGDGMFVEFASVVQALRAALAIQHGLAGFARDTPRHERIVLRIGLHQGDVMVQGADLLGDGVNIAARLESLAPAGGICMSARVREDAAGKIALAVEDGGTRTLKHITQAMRVFMVRPPQNGTAAAPILARPERHLVAVLPFASSDSEAATSLAAALSERLVPALSRWPGLLAAVGAPLPGRAGLEETVAAGQAIGAAYVLRGAVRQDGDRIVAAVRVLSVATGHPIWNDKEDAELAGAPTLLERWPDQVAAALGTLLSPDATPVEGESTQVTPAAPVFLQQLVLVESVVADPAQGQVVILDGDGLVLGRQPPSDLVLPSGEVSRAHCRIDIAGQAATVTDLGSTNGTFVNDRRITAPTRLTVGDLLRLGPYVLRYATVADGPGPDPEATMVTRMPGERAGDAT